MKKISENNKILALTECLILWDRLAKTGTEYKDSAILELRKEKKLHKKDYSCDCPFCDRFKDGDNCNDCIWPKEKNYPNWCRCTLPDSPFTKWQEQGDNKKKRKEYAKEVLELLLTIEI